MGRPRKIRTTEEAAGAPPQEDIPEGGIVFGNNQPNREFHYGAGKKYKFSGTRNIITDPELIAVLDKQSKTDRTLFRLEDPEQLPETPLQEPTDAPPIFTQPVEPEPEPKE